MQAVGAGGQGPACGIRRPGLERSPREGEVDASPALASLVADAEFADEHAEFLYPSAYVDLGPTSARLAADLLAADSMTSAALPAMSSEEKAWRSDVVKHVVKQLNARGIRFPPESWQQRRRALIRASWNTFAGPRAR